MKKGKLIQGFGEGGFGIKLDYAKAPTVTNHTNDPERIKLLQQDLTKFGYKVKVDGILGPETLDAINKTKETQAALGVKVDGWPGEKTRAAFDNKVFDLNIDTLSKINVRQKGGVLIKL